MSQANQIRQYIRRQYFQNLRTGDVVNIRAGDVHSDMGFQNRMPNVCSVLDGSKLAKECSIQLIRRIGPRQGANACFTFKLVENSLHEYQLKTAVAEKSGRVTSGGQQFSKPRNVTAHLPDNAICLVSCVAKKKLTRATAKDLYISDWFLKARHFVESKGFQWFILSAKHGLIAPDKLIAPYEKTLNTMRSNDRRLWAHNVLRQIEATLPKEIPIIFLAGQKYREYLTEPLKVAGNEVYVPMEGLTIGRQLAWLQAQV